MCSLGFDALTSLRFQLTLTIDTVPETLIGKWFNLVGGRTWCRSTGCLLFVVYMLVFFYIIHSYTYCISIISLLVIVWVPHCGYSELMRTASQSPTTIRWLLSTSCGHVFRTHAMNTHVNRRSNSATWSQIVDNEVRRLISKAWSKICKEFQIKSTKMH